LKSAIKKKVSPGSFKNKNQGVFYTDNQLLKRVADKKCERSFNQLYKTYYNKGLGLVRKILRKHNHMDVESVLNLAFFKIWDRASTFKGDSRAATWIYRVVANEALMYLRKAKTISGHELRLTWEGVAIQDEEFYGAREGLIRLNERMDPHMKVTLSLIGGGYTSKEVSKIINEAEPAIKSRIFRWRGVERRACG